jgi:hypothetical protein
MTGFLPPSHIGAVDVSRKPASKQRARIYFAGVNRNWIIVFGSRYGICAAGTAAIVAAGRAAG